MKKLIYLLLIFGTTFSTAHSQVITQYCSKGEASSLGVKVKKNLLSTALEMPSFDVRKLLEEDEKIRSADIPYRFGYGFEVNYTLYDGAWEQLDSGRLWSITFKSNGALSLNFVFSNFFLPDGAYVNIVNSEESIVYGPVTSDNIPKDGFFLTDLIEGSIATIYLFEPNEHSGESSLTINKVVHRYCNLYNINDGYGNINTSASCNLPVESYFPDYQKEANAIALILLEDGTSLCSGSLVMSTDLLFKPYMLTAFHCVNTEIHQNYEPIDMIISSSEASNVNHWLIKFGYRQQSTYSITFNGAQFRSGWFDSDFALVELYEDVKQFAHITWLGWDRTGNTPSSGVGIHHPRGDYMKISIDEDSSQEDLYPSQSFPSHVTSHWLEHWEEGITQGGSSGSPLLNENKRVVGQLHGVHYEGNHSQYTAPCLINYSSYGKFSTSWTGGGTNSTRLSNWLDPISTNQTTINSSHSSIISGSNMLCFQGTYTINNMPSDSCVALNTNYSSTGFSIQVSSNLSIVSYSNGSLTLQKVSDGRGYIKIFYQGNLISTKEMWVGGPIITDLFYAGGYIYSETDYMSQAVDDFYWIVNGVTYHSIEGRKRLNLPYGTYNVEAYAYNSCGRGPSKFTQIVTDGTYSLGNVSSDHQVTVTTADYSDGPKPLELQTKAKTPKVPYTLQNALTGEVVARGEMPIGGGVLDFSRVRSGLYALTLTPEGGKAETFKVSFK